MGVRKDEEKETQKVRGTGTIEKRERCECVFEREEKKVKEYERVCDGEGQTVNKRGRERKKINF